MMIYSHCVFLILRIVASRIFEEDPRTYSITLSFLLSVDIIVALTMYLLPKIFLSYIKLSEGRSQRFLSRFSWRKGPAEVDPASNQGNSSLYGLSVASDSAVPESDKHQRVPAATVSVASQSQEFRKVSLPKQTIVKSCAMTDDPLPQDANSELPSHPQKSVDAWVDDCNNESEDPNCAATSPENHLHKSELQNRPMLESKGNSDKIEELREQLFQRDQEVLELKREVRVLQETNMCQESKINGLLESREEA